jgi:hypothetical protein
MVSHTYYLASSVPFSLESQESEEGMSALKQNGESVKKNNKDEMNNLCL